MKILDGWRTWLSAVGWIGVLIYGTATGHDVRPIAEAIAKAVGVTSPTATDWMFYFVAANSALALWGICGKAYKGWKQWRAGASLSQLESPQGVIRLAIADGTLTSATGVSVVLNMTDKAPTEAKAAPVVASLVAEPTPTEAGNAPMVIG